MCVCGWGGHDIVVGDAGGTTVKPGQICWN